MYAVTTLQRHYRLQNRRFCVFHPNLGLNFVLYGLAPKYDLQSTLSVLDYIRIHPGNLVMKIQHFKGIIGLKIVGFVSSTPHMGFNLALFAQVRRPNIKYGLQSTLVAMSYLLTYPGNPFMKLHHFKHY